MEPPVASDADGDRDRLSGWKEVALYLRRGVRTAQRWEKELGLPVHRLKTRNGQVLYAKRVELDAWMVNHEASLADAGEDEAHEGAAGEGDRGVSEAPSERSGGASRAFLLLVAVAVAVVVVVAIVGAWLYFKTAPDAVSSIRVDGQKIEATGPSGKVLWIHDLPHHANYYPVPELAEGTHTGHATRVDLTGDGITNLLVPLRFQIAGQQPITSDAVIAFADHGDVLWSVEPDDVRLTFGGVTYGAPWRLLTAYVSSGPDGRRVWLSFAHHTWWPSFVVEVTSDGRQSMRHVQPGWITALAEWSVDGRDVMVAGGVLNEPGRGAVTLIDLANPLTVMPAGSPHYASDLTGAQPLRAYTFPPLEVPSAQQQPYSFVHRVRRIGEGLRIDINSYAHVWLSPVGGFAEFSFTDLYRKEHEVLGAARLIDHTLLLCPEPTQTKDIRTWTASTGWLSTPFEPALAHRGP